MTDDTLCFLSAVELANGYCQNRFSPVEVADAHLGRIEALDGTIHAYTEVFAGEARQAAAASAQRFRNQLPLGPLDGVPVAVKDLIEIAGKACAAGSLTRKGLSPTAPRRSSIA